MNLYEGIVEVVDSHGGRAGAGGANDYLEHGYRLLHIDTESFSAKHPGPAGQFFVRRRLRFVVGRTVETAQWSPPPREQAAERAAE